MKKFRIQYCHVATHDDTEVSQSELSQLLPTPLATPTPMTPTTPVLGRTRRLISTPTINSPADLTNDRLALTRSLIGHLKTNVPKVGKTKLTSIQRTHHGVSLTEAEAIAAVQAAKEAAIEKKANKNSKTKQDKKSKSVPSRETQSVDPNPTQTQIISGETQSGVIAVVKSCFKCKIGYTNNNDWRSCEKCPKWFCPKCIPKRYLTNPSLEFFCTKKCSN